ncbi:hypothetical protein ACSQ67_008467 [Phaseolus vulgaris]
MDLYAMNQRYLKDRHDRSSAGGGARRNDHRPPNDHRATSLLSLSNPDATVLSFFNPDTVHTAKGAGTTAPTTNRRVWVLILILNAEPSCDQPRHRCEALPAMEMDE